MTWGRWPGPRLPQSSRIEKLSNLNPGSDFTTFDKLSNLNSNLNSGSDLTTFEKLSNLNSNLNSGSDLTTFEKLSNLNPSSDLTTFEKLSNLNSGPDLTTSDKLSNLECIITKIWQEVLCLNKIDLHETFFEIGGHSLLLVQVQEKLTVALNRPVPITVLLQYPTIHTLASYLNQSSTPESTRFDSTVARAKQQRAARLKRMNNE